MKIRTLEEDARGRRFVELSLKGSLLHDMFNAGENSLGSLMQRLAYTESELITSLNNMLKLHDHATQQSGTILGKIRSLFVTPEDPEWMQIDGTRLIQFHHLTQKECPEQISASKTYYVETEAFRKLLREVTPAQT